MKKNIFIFIYIIILLIPNTISFADGTLIDDFKTTKINAPTERILGSNGDWYSSIVNLNGKSKLVVGYKGEYTIDGEVNSKMSMKFKIRDKSIVKEIYFPFVKKAESNLTFKITDISGNIIGPFNLNGVLASNSENESINNTSYNYTYTPKQNIVLDKGEYFIELSSSKWHVKNEITGLEGAFLVKGVNFSRENSYLKKIAKEEGYKELEKEPIENSEEFNEKKIDDYNTSDLNESVSKKEPFFRLDEESLLNAITINTINSGKGALPGFVNVLDENKVLINSYQAVGGSLNNVANGIWAIYPQLILPKGDYYFELEDPNIIGYDKNGNPEFFVNISLPVVEELELEGTYLIDFDSYKVKTLMGTILNPQSSLNLKDFKIAVMDKGNSIEIIGNYKGMPFSQSCEVSYRDETHIEADFNFYLDSKKLLNQATISANGKIIVGLSDENEVFFILDGEAFYSKKDGDKNTYELVGKGRMLTNDLPGYVMAAINASSSVGAIPGPDNSTQAATGLLFPPLIGLIASAIQKMLKKPKKISNEHNLGWYRRKYPKASDDTIAMIMLGDAMANTDEPDNDSVSIGDNEVSQETGVNENDEIDDYENSPSDESSSEEPNKEIYEEDLFEETEKDVKLTEEVEPALEVINKPETIELETGPHGRKSTYELDKETGEYINPETGGVLDNEAYEKVVKPNLQKNEDFINEQSEINATGNTKFDKDLRNFIKKQKQEIKKEKYMKVLSKKYHTDDPKKLEKIINESNDYYEKRAELWNKTGDIFEVAEKTAEITQTGADLFIDGAANMTGPVGRGIRAGYKFTKNVAGTVADKGVSVSSVAGGMVKGAADAGSDFVSNPYLKAGVTIAGETVGNSFTDEKGITHGLKDGFIDGTYKATIGVITDKIGGGGYGNDITSEVAGKNIVKLSIKTKSGWVARNVSSKVATKFVKGKLIKQGMQSATKLGGTVFDELKGKPLIKSLKG